MPSLRIGNLGDLSFPASGFEDVDDFELNNLDSRLVCRGLLGGTGGADAPSETCDAARSVKGLVYWLSGDWESESLNEATLTPAAFCAS